MIKWMVVVVMFVIFYMSSQPGDLSGDISGGISHMLMEIYNAILGLNWNDVQILQMARTWDLPIRKLAHMTEFGILAVLVFCALRSYEKIKPYRYIVTIGLCMLYAISDEIHQLFVPDRDGNVVDVFIDTLGICIALGCVWMISQLVKLIKNNNERKR